MKKIEMDTLCYMCYLKRNMDIAHSLGDEETACAFLKDLMQMYLDAPAGVSSPWFGPQVADLITKYYGLTDDDRYGKEKEESNRFVMERYSQLQAAVRQEQDPVLAGLRWAILGNYIDFSALRGQVSFQQLEEMMASANAMELDMDTYARLCKELETGKELLYLCDNAGEIGFDRLFAEEIAKAYPHLSITFCVRGAVTANDATREDAAAVGIPFPVIDNGNRIAGTQMDQLSNEAQQALDTADVIIAKGMANTETMWGCDYNVYYAFLVKCQRFVNLFEKPLFTPMLVRQRDKGEK